MKYNLIIALFVVVGVFSTGAKHQDPEIRNASSTNVLLTEISCDVPAVGG